MECSGQSKLLVKAGRVILIPESIVTLDDAPKVAADYELALASVHGLICQLELELNDEHQRRIRDWSGCVLRVLLHGASGPDFTRQHRMLGSLMLGVTDNAYSQWVLWPPRSRKHKLFAVSWSAKPASAKAGGAGHPALRHSDRHCPA